MLVFGSVPCEDVSCVTKSDQDFKTTWLGEYALNGSVEASIFKFRMAKFTGHVK